MKLKSEAKVPSGVFAANKPEEVLSELGVWTPKDFAKVLDSTTLSTEEKRKQMYLFTSDYKDAVSFFGDEMEIDLKTVATQRGGNGKKRARYDSLAEVKTDQDSPSPDNRPTRCVLSNGEEVAEGDVFAVCERIKNEMKEDTTEQKLVKRAYENAMEKCKELGLTGADFMTCVETKKKEMEAIIKLQEQVMGNMRSELDEIINIEQNTDKDSDIYESMLKNAPNEETRGWLSTILSGLWTGMKWVASKTYSLVTWILSHPRVAKLVFIFIKQSLKTMCQYVQLNWVRNIKVVYQEPKSMFQTLEEFRANFFKNYMPLLITEGSRFFMDLGGFEFTWNTVSIVTSGALTAVLGFIPGVGSSALALSSMVGAVMRESCKVTLTAAIELADIDVAFSTLKDIIIMMLPIEILKDAKTGQFMARWNKVDPDSCWTIMTTPILVQGPLENPLQSEHNAQRFRAQNANIAGVQQTKYSGEFRPLDAEQYFDPKQREKPAPPMQPDYRGGPTRVAPRDFEDVALQGVKPLVQNEMLIQTRGRTMLDNDEINEPLRTEQAYADNQNMINEYGLPGPNYVYNTTAARNNRDKRRRGGGLSGLPPTLNFL